MAGFEAKHGGSVDNYFRDEVWAKVAAQNCLKCHKAGGDAEDTKLVLQDPSRDPHPERLVSLQHNRDAFARIALRQHAGKSRLLLKAIGKLSHEGEEVVKPDSTEYRILEEFVRRLNAPADAKPVLRRDNAPPFFEGISMARSSAVAASRDPFARGPVAGPRKWRSSRSKGCLRSMGCSTA